jgi:hypothetical protein
MEQKIKAAKIFAKLLDSQFEIGGVRFGIDPILDIIPWFGDIAGAVLSLYILHTAWTAQVSKMDFMKMILNIIVDFVVGAIPILGVIFDVIFKANMRNIKILEKYSHGKFIEGKIVQ